MTALLTSVRSRVSRIGVDVGAASIRAVQLRRVDAVWELVRSVQTPARHDQSAEPDLQASADCVRSLIKRHRFVGRTAAAAIGPPQAELHVLEVPAEAAANNGPDKAVHAELERLLHAGGEEYELAYWSLPKKRADLLGAVGVAVRREHALRIWEFCGRAGLDCRQIDASACALARFAAVLRNPRPNAAHQVHGVLDLGHSSARLILCLGDVPVLTRVFDAGGSRWTSLIAEWFGISTQSAEVHKCEQGVLADRSGGASSAGSLNGMLHAVLRTELESLASQLERSYAYVLQYYPQSAAGGLLLTGGGAALPNLDRYLAGKLGIDVRAAAFAPDSGSAILKDARPAELQKVPLPELAVAVGLAIPAEAAHG
ncbi:MAG: pilus assembly protein PilM [Phycisphaerae bacterium]|nr:pilus assembly protein PilM [Phycisphaerae bacterium]